MMPPTTDDLTAEATRFLLDEAAALNDDRHEDWLELITDDFDYRMPAPCLRDDPSEPRYDEDALLTWESANSLRLRFERLSSEFAWADRPPALHRRHLTAIRVLGGLRTAASGLEEFEVASDVLLARSRRPDGTHLVSAGRRDILRRGTDGGLLLARRRVYIDHVLPNVTEISILF